MKFAWKNFRHALLFKQHHYNMKFVYTHKNFFVTHQNRKRLDQEILPCLRHMHGDDGFWQ